MRERVSAINPTQGILALPGELRRARAAAIGRLFCAFPSRQIHVLFRFAQPLTFTQFLGSLHFFDPQTCGVTVVTQQHVAKGVRTASGAREERHGRWPGDGRGGAGEPRLQRRQPGRDRRGRRHRPARGAREERRGCGQKWAALALVRLADDDDIRTSIVEAGAIDPLVALLRSDAAKEDYRQTGPHYGWRSSWAAEVVSLVNMATGPSWLDYPFLSPDLRIYL